MLPGWLARGPPAAFSIRVATLRAVVERPQTAIPRAWQPLRRACRRQGARAVLLGQQHPSSTKAAPRQHRSSI
eukprot:11183205-Lingulodinium_polyedra.AAC.1